jgi:MFS family permease
MLNRLFNIKNIYKSLKHRNYRLFFLGQSISLIGTWMQRMAVSWLVYRTTESAFLLGVVSFATQFPTFLFGPYGGVMTDRYNRYKILLTTQFFALIQAAILAYIVLTEKFSIFHIIILSLMLGLINAFDTPSRQSLMFELVDNKEDLPNAIALNSSMVHLARLIGPAIAGVFLLKLGEGFCFLLNALSFIAVITSLLLMKIPSLKKQINETSPGGKIKTTLWGDFWEGLNYLQKTPDLKIIIFRMALISLMVMPYTTLLPVFARDIFHGNSSTFAWLNSVTGLGALSGAFYLASLTDNSRFSKILIYLNFIFGLSLIIFSFTRVLPVALFFATLSGFGMMCQSTISNTIVQTTVSDKIRGRVMSFFSMSFFGMQPIGSFFIGLTSERIGAQSTVLIQGIACIIIGFIFLPYLKNFNHNLQILNAGKTPEEL